MNEPMSQDEAEAFLAEIRTRIQNILRDQEVPSEEEVGRLYAKAQELGCGLAVFDGKPGTLQPSLGVPAGTLIIYKPDDLLGRDQ